jgi:hypothetical protein
MAESLLTFLLGAFLGSLATIIFLGFLFGIAEHKDNKDININE